MTFAELDLSKLYTYADYFKWKFDERVELIKGKVFQMSPAPNRMHQRVVGELHLRLRLSLKGSTCDVYLAPFDVRLPRKSKKTDTDVITVLQPDLCIICDKSKLDERGCLGAPDVVFEVLSPGNSKKELKLKYEAYEEAGVLEYWIISPQNEWITVHRLVDGRFATSPYYFPGDTVSSSVFPAFSFDPAELFEEPE